MQDICALYARTNPSVPSQEFLIEQGHDADFVSRNTDWQSPLMAASVAGKEDMGVMLAKKFPHSIAMQDKAGLDAVGFPFPYPYLLDLTA